MQLNIFGEKIEGITYQKRMGVYAVIFNFKKDRVAAVKTTNGHYFLPGGGIEKDEKFEECLRREVLEEIGYEISIRTYIGNAMMHYISTKNEPILSNSYFFTAQLGEKILEPIEEDHFFEWIKMEEIEKRLVHDHHIWGVKEGLKIYNVED